MYWEISNSRNLYRLLKFVLLYKLNCVFGTLERLLSFFWQNFWQNYFNAHNLTTWIHINESVFSKRYRAFNTPFALSKPEIHRVSFIIILY